MSVLKKSLRVSNYLSLSVKLILIVSIFNAIYQGLWHIMSANVLLLVLLFAPQVLKKSAKVVIPREFECLLLAFVIFTFFLRESRGVIVPISFGVGMGFISLMILFLLYHSNQIKKNKFLILTFPLSFTIMLSVFLELLKLDLKFLFGEALTEGVYKIAMMNLLYVTIGAVIATMFGYIYLQTHADPFKRIIRRFLKYNPSVLAKVDNPLEILELIEQGENDGIEFKSTLRTNLHTGEVDKKIEHTALKTIAAFLNSKGGILLIGVSDSGEIVGTEKDNFPNSDKLHLHFTNLIRDKLGKKSLAFIQFESVLIEGKNVLKVQCAEANKPIFLKTSDSEEFYIRVGPSSLQIIGSELVEYIEEKFKKN